MAFRPEKAAENETRYFQQRTESIAPTRIAFIGTGGTASASELVMNAFIPWLHAEAALIGTTPMASRWTRSQSIARPATIGCG